MSAAATATVQAPSFNDNNTPDDEEWCHMQVKMIKCSYTWTINNFSLCGKKTGDMLKSPSFSPASNDKLKWRLKMYPEGTHDQYKEYVSLFLILVSDPENEVRAKFKFFILNAKQERTRCQEIKDAHRFHEGIYSEWGYKTFIRRNLLLDEANGLLPNDKLTIFCEVSVVEDIIDISEPSTVLQFEVPQYKLFKELGSLFKNQKFSDITLTAGGKDFFVHKAILAARSPVFAAMFEHEMVEKKENRVVISDVKPNVLEEMLRYVYTGETQNIDKMATNLLAAANKYDLEILKDKCGKILYSKLTVENAAETLIFADLHDVVQLKTQAIDFIVTHATHVIATSAWKNMIPTHPHLINDVCQALAAAFDAENR